jgi:DNA-binding NtrC family response regulator/Mg2+/Co2+ transporter CorC
MKNKEQVSNLIKTKMKDASSDCLMTSLRVELEVQDVMSKDMTTISSGESVVSATKTMCENNISCMVVVDNGSVVGILTERDLLKRIAAKEKDYSKITIAETMSSPVETISPNLPVLEAGRIMEDKHIKRLPVIEKKRLVGIITQTELTRLLTSSAMWRNVVEIMTWDVAGIQCKASVAEAAEVMTSRHISCIVTLEKDEVVGVLTERDLLKRVVGPQKDPADVKAEEVMSSPVICVPPDCPVFTASRIMENIDIRLRRRLKTEQSFAGIVGRDAKMLELFDTIREVAEVNVPVLIQGESGTGKELVAAAIHNEGHNADKPFVPVNCGALPEGILESELFGHVKGAFTGAIRDRKGRFEMADGGTIFLDEIGDIPGAMQVKLLRVLQEGTFQRVGGEETVKVDVRVISATNKDLAEEVAAGRFREDLFYRLCVVPVYLPPLRERRNDIGLLADHLLKRALTEVGREGAVLSPEVVDAMMDYDWPGNVRELENTLRYALVKCRDNLILPEHLPLNILNRDTARQPSAKRHRKHKLDAERVQRTLEETGGNKIEAARRLGVSRATLYRFLQESEKTSKIPVL